MEIITYLCKSYSSDINAVYQLVNKNMLRKTKVKLAFCAAILLVGCMREGEDTIILPTMNREIPEHVISRTLLDTIRIYMPINVGSNPPSVAGTYSVSPFDLVYASDGYEGEFHDLEWHIDTPDSWNRTRYSEHQGTAEGRSQEAYIIGNGENFTIFTIDNSVDTLSGWQCRLVTLISGTKRESSVADLRYAILMLDKRDEHNMLIEPDSYRIFADGDGNSPKVAK